jgi:TPR repeat protein
MNQTEKILAIVGLAVLIIGALVIRHQDAGYIAFLKRDYQTAHAEFSKLAQKGDPWGTYFTGLMHEIFLRGSINRTEAVKYYLAGARLGNIRSAIRYISHLKFLNNLNQKSQFPVSRICPIYTDLVNKAVQTHNPYAIILKAQQMNSGSCVQEDQIAGAHFFKWAGEVKPQISVYLFNAYDSFSDFQKNQFKAFKIERPLHISDQEFLKYFLAKLPEIETIKFD